MTVLTHCTSCYSINHLKGFFITGIATSRLQTCTIVDLQIKDDYQKLHKLVTSQSWCDVAWFLTKVCFLQYFSLSLLHLFSWLVMILLFCGVCRGWLPPDSLGNLNVDHFWEESLEELLASLVLALVAGTQSWKVATDSHSILRWIGEWCGGNIELSRKLHLKLGARDRIIPKK